MCDGFRGNATGKRADLLTFQNSPFFGQVYPPPPPPPLQISGYAPESNYVFALLIFMPPEFSLMPDFKSINFYQNKAKIKLFLQKKIIFFERWGLRTQTPNGTRWIGRSCQTLETASPRCRFLVTRQILNVWCDIKRAYFQVVESYNDKLLS